MSGEEKKNTDMYMSLYRYKHVNMHRSGCCGISHEEIMPVV